MSREPPWLASIIWYYIFTIFLGQDWLESDVNKHAQPLRLLFTDQTKVITSSGGQNSVTQMIGSLYDAIEIQYGMFASRWSPAFKIAQKH